ncbi:NADP-dependent 3-hydroxy acid dehydrogenase YdfG [Actinacidiphila yanglinensis]|uniref:NADP-dependent 3-hydroxy acid dehydrogenase YdfG n=1 Tax=Actinacidiphila yanglinensis TaxID=310779 RepID=A0A1H5SW28_9ACTN|nr:SDR family oxidoreductase [Actinacidiphila yanglinensis]SEF54674.1 NADP-dependent 3-hydroxy acid dehydrogenase YdfG [Actinacidiphila yanglinensis]
MSGINGKVVAITGASSGVGAATARLLARGGAKLVLGARREDRLAGLAADLRGDGAEVAYRRVDVRDRADQAALVELARERFGRLDVLVGNAGIGPISPLDDLRVDDWDTMIDVNVKGLLHGIAAALPVFRAQGHGQFVHTASTAAYRTVPGQAVYSASKAAARTLTEGLRQEAGPSIRVSTVSPGFVATEFLKSVPDPETRASMTETMDAIAIPPEAVARAIRFAIEQPAEVDVNEIVVRPTAQG